MSLRRRQFSKDLKVQIVRELQAGKMLAQTGREHQINPGALVAWRKQHEQYGEQAFQGHGHAYTAEARIAELERVLGQAALEIALRERALLRLEAQVRTGESGGSR